MLNIIIQTSIPYKKFAFLIGIFILFLAIPISAQTGEQRDRQALEALFTRMGGADWENAQSWMKGHISSWNFVEFDNSINRVVGLRMVEVGLTGMMPDEIGLLDELRVLDLSGNGIFGTLPNSFGNLTKLKELNLSRNGLSDFPPNLGNLKSLEYFNISGNRMSSQVPQSLGTLTNLKHINISSNGLIGAIPGNFNNLTKLEVLNIENNNGINSLPSLPGSPNLKELYAANCNLDFGHLEPYTYLFPENTAGSRYAPQEFIHQQEYRNIYEEVEKQIPIYINSNANGENDRYQWYKDAVEMKNGGRISGATSSELVINNPTEDDLGRYDCVVTNSSLPYLTLHRFSVHLIYEKIELKSEDVESRFQIDFVEGCSPHTITITNLVDTDVVQYQIQGRSGILNDPAPAVGSQINYTFTQPGNYRVTQIVQSNNEEKTAFMNVRVHRNFAPELELISCSNNRVKVNIKNKSSLSFQDIEIDFGDGKGTVVYNKNENIEYGYAQSGEYFVTAKGYIKNGTSTSCQSTTNPVDVFDRPPVVDIRQVEVNSDQTITLRAEGSTSFRYRLEMATNGNNNYAPVEASFSDLVVRTGKLNVNTNYYCFRIVTLDECGNNPAYSAPICSIQLNVTGEHKQNRLNWRANSPPNTRFQILRDNQLLAEGDFVDDEYLDTDVVCNITNSYSVSQVNSQGQISRSIVIDHTTRALIPKDSVNGKEILASVEGVSLSWEVPFENPEWYYVYKEESGKRRLLDSTQTNSYTERNMETKASQVCYYITYKDDCLLESEIGTPICFNTGINLVFPNAFAPNSTPPNHEFKPVGEFFGKYNIQIFNRWGELLYETQNINEGWDGTYNGQLVQQGSYVYKVSMIDLGGRRFNQSGTVLLIK